MQLPAYLLIAVLGATLLAGCSEMRFANAPDQATGYDPREDMRLTNVVTDMTSGSVMVNQVISSVAVYSEARNLLEMEAVQVHSFGDEGRPQGVTSADKGIVYLDDDRKAGRNRDDIEFIGNVRHRALKSDDPTSDAMTLQTEHLFWDEVAQRFKCDTFYKMVINRPQAPPMIAMGDGFIATRDMRSWNVKYGAITTEEDLNAREKSNKLREQMTAEVARREAGDASAVLQAQRDLPIQIPSDMPSVPGEAPVAQQSAEGQAGAPQTEVVGDRKLIRLPGAAPTRPAQTPVPTPVSDDVKRAMEPSP